ncbi:hypothetical protein Syun_007334 [Stephania yunnanensis]|uniref:SMP domain-containing protein n=1 Tax=Stephania yunnanensis TaxID=152371 RepID=A0AAP0KYB2_9MAGN
MSQEQPIKYGDVFPVSGDLADKPIAPGDAAMMQSAERQILGGAIEKGGAAAAMQSAASRNESAGFVSHREVCAGDQEGMTVTETEIPGRRIITKSIDGQLVEQYTVGEPEQQPLPPGPVLPTKGISSYTPTRTNEQITIGEALEASAMTAGDKPLDKRDAAAIQAAEVRATGGRINITSWGLAAEAQAAASANERTFFDENKTKLGDLLQDASAKLPSDKPATRQDAEGITAAEMRNDPDMSTHPGGVAASVVAAARLNESLQINESNFC